MEIWTFPGVTPQYGGRIFEIVVFEPNEFLISHFPSETVTPRFSGLGLSFIFLPDT